MRSREEINKSIYKPPLPQYATSEEKQRHSLGLSNMLIAEMLLDIRDLLTPKENK